MATPTSISEQLLRDDGEVLHLYFDSLGYGSIGVGRMIDKRKGGGISMAESRMLLTNDVAHITSELHARFPWADSLDPVRFAVLQNMGINLGIDGLSEFVNMLAAMQAHDWGEAAKQMLNSAWAKEVGPRATRLSVQVVTGKWQ